MARVGKVGGVIAGDQPGVTNGDGVMATGAGNRVLGRNGGDGVGEFVGPSNGDGKSDAENRGESDGERLL